MILTYSIVPATNNEVYLLSLLIKLFVETHVNAPKIVVKLSLCKHSTETEQEIALPHRQPNSERCTDCIWEVRLE